MPVPVPEDAQLDPGVQERNLVEDSQMYPR
jgi:hypothetical protein